MRYTVLDGHPGSTREPDPGKRAGRHRRATRRSRFTADQAGTALRGADLLVRVVQMARQCETPPSEWFNSLAGLAVKILDAIGSLPV